MDDPYISSKNPLREELEGLKECWPELAKIYSIVFVVAVAYELITRIAS